MSQQQRQALHELMSGSPLDLGGDIVEQRAILHQLLTAHPLPSDVIVAPIDLAGVAALSVRIDDQPSEGTVLFFHGGVFSMGSAQASLGLASDLARRAHTRVITVDYRLAPEHPYPAGPEDALIAYRALLEADGPGARLAIAGESAGGNLAVVTLLNIRDAGLALPAAVFVMSPWTDLAVTGASADTKAGSDPALTAPALRLRARDYLGDVDPAAPTASPIYADLTGLPPMLVQVGSDEILLDDAVRLAAKAAADDVAVTLDVTPGVPHVFQAFTGLLDEAGEALDRAALFLRTQLDAVG